MFPVKYRWPVFHLDATSEQDYSAVIDEECKVRARTPQVSKFRHISFDFSDNERREIYVHLVKQHGRSRANNMAAFFQATFDAWKDHNRSGAEQVYIGYSPIIVVDADKILGDLPNAHIVHVVRNPWSAYADTKKRPVPLSIQHYMTGWVINQYHALLFKEQFPERVHIIRIEDVLENPYRHLGELCKSIELDPADSLHKPTWNGHDLEEIYPWGTIRKATPEANKATAEELSSVEKAEIRAYTSQLLEVFDYENFLNR
jgi:hypothetical protein